MAESKSVAITVALIGAAATILTAVIMTRGGGGGDGGDVRSPSPEAPVVLPSLPSGPPGPPGFGKPASVFLSRDSGPGGATVQVSGEGFAPGEAIVITFHTEQIGTTTASDQGRFSNVAVTIPRSFSEFAPQQFFVSANGRSSIKSARAPFTISG